MPTLTFSDHTYLVALLYVLPKIDSMAFLAALSANVQRPQLPLGVPFSSSRLNKTSETLHIQQQHQMNTFWAAPSIPAITRPAAALDREDIQDLPSDAALVQHTRRLIEQYPQLAKRQSQEVL